MTTLSIPRIWAETGTKTDPGGAAALTGFVAGNPVASAAQNYLLNQLSLAARSALRIALCKPRRVNVVLDDTSGTIAVVGRGRGTAAVVGTMHSAGTPWLTDSEPALEAGVVTSITSAVRAAAYNPTADRLVLGGIGGNRCCYSDDSGATWTAGGDVGGTVGSMIWNPTYSRFIAAKSGNVAYAANATAWTNVVVSGANFTGIGMLSNGDMVQSTSAAAPVTFSRSQNGGTSWAAAGTLVNAADIDVVRTAGAGFAAIYCAGVRISDGLIAVEKTLDGTSWAQTALLTPPTGFTFTANTLSMKQCADSGVIFLTVQMSGDADTTAIYASLDGADWLEPMYAGSGLTAPFSSLGLGAANGRLFLASGNGSGELFASDGIIW